MTLLITVFMAIAATVAWYTSKRARKLKIGNLCLMFWGASLMWFIDAAVEYLNSGAEYFMPPVHDMINDSFLGICVAALGLMIWLISLMISDPEKTVKNMLHTGKRISNGKNAYKAEE